MNRIRFLRSAALEDLRSGIRQNLPKYRSGNFGDIAADSSYWFEYDTEFDESAIANLRAPLSGDYFEVHNCTILYQVLKGLTPYEARDERLWVYLCHTTLLEHGRARWPIPLEDDAAVKYIEMHFFARDKRQIERENLASRLWWMAHLCARVVSIDQEKALRAFLYRSDVRASVIERPTTSQCSALFNVLVHRLSASLDGEKNLFERTIFRKLMMEINSVGGYKLLDCLPDRQIEGIVDEIIGKKLQLKNL